MPRLGVKRRREGGEFTSGSPKKKAEAAEESSNLAGSGEDEVEGR